VGELSARSLPGGRLGKVFNVPTTVFPETPKRERKNVKRSRRKTENDRHISKTKRDFFEKVGSALGLRKDELQSIKGTALFPKRAKNGLWYIRIDEHTKGRRYRISPIMAKNAEEEVEIIELFRKAGSDYVFSGRHGTHRVPKKLDEHEHRAEYAKRVYLHYERELEKLPEQKKTRLRKELKGQILDKFAELKTSEALAHGRDGEFRKSYVYKLLE